jgi:hypothetical protein
VKELTKKELNNCVGGLKDPLDPQNPGGPLQDPIPNPFPGNNNQLK